MSSPPLLSLLVLSLLAVLSLSVCLTHSRSQSHVPCLPCIAVCAPHILLPAVYTCSRCSIVFRILNPVLRSQALAGPFHTHASPSPKQHTHAPDAREADRLRVLVHCVSLLEDPSLHSNFANALLAESTSALGLTAPASLVSLAHEILARVRGDDLPVGRVLELLPPLLSRIAAQDHIAGEARSGPQLKAFLLNRLCSGAWPPNAVIRLANAFRMVEMTSEQLRFALDKLLRSLSEIALEEMPALVYQLLLLSSKVST